MPNRVTAVLGTRAHNIEVEDTANIICEYKNGKTGYIYATTAEQPGYSQLLLAGDKGTLIVEGDEIRLGKLKKTVTDSIMKSKTPWPDPKAQKTTWSTVPYRKLKFDGAHISVMRAFAKHIRTGSPMVASGAEAIDELELSNAAYISGYKDRRVDLPVSASEMDRLLAALEREHSTGRGENMRTIATRKLKTQLRK